MLTYQRFLVPALGLSLVLLGATGCNRDPNVRKHKYLESGIRYENEGKDREAAIQISNALKIDHNFPDAHYELAKVYLKMQAAPAAYGELLKTVDLAPNNIQARLDLGNLALRGGLPDMAFTQGQAILAAQPRNADAFALLAGVAVRRGDHDEALKRINQALEIQPNNATFHTSLAMLKGVGDDNGAAAEQELRKAIALDNTAVTAHLALAELLQRNGSLPEALQQATTAVQVAPKSLLARQTLVGLLLRQGKKPEAEQVLRKATIDFSDSETGAELLSDYYVHTGQLDEAENAYAQLAADNPKNFNLNFEYARILILRHKDDKAQQVDAELRKMSPKSPQTIIVDSSLLLDANKVDEAFSNLDTAVHNSPDNLMLRLALGKVSLRKYDLDSSNINKQDLDNAESNFHEAERINPNNLDAQIGLAEVADKRGDITLLMNSADKALAINPDFPSPYIWRATAEANQGQFDKAEADLKTELTHQPNSPQAYVELAQIRLVQNKIPEGLEMLEKALAIDPNSFPALHQIVRVDMLTKHPEKAIARVQQQIALAPQNSAFYTELSALQIAVHDFNAAHDSANKAVQLNPRNARAVQAVAESDVALGQIDAAIGVWNQWLAKNPSDADATTMVAELEDTKGDKSAAAAGYKKALELNPHETVAQNNLAYLLLETGGDLDQALSLAQQARTAAPHLANTADTLAWVYYHKGMYGSSRDLLEDAVKTDPNDPSIEYHLGMAYLKLGDKPNALLHLKKAATIAPNTQNGKDAAAALAQVG